MPISPPGIIAPGATKDSQWKHCPKYQIHAKRHDSILSFWIIFSPRMFKKWSLIGVAQVWIEKANRYRTPKTTGLIHRSYCSSFLHGLLCHFVIQVNLTCGVKTDSDISPTNAHASRACTPLNASGATTGASRWRRGRWTQCLNDF